MANFTFKDIVGQEMIKEQLQGAIANNKVSHAYIINGENRSGKEFIAKIFAQTLLCEKGETDPCCECPSCQKAMSGNHHDIIFVSHEKPNTIGVDDIRDGINDTVFIKPYSSNYKIYIIQEAEKMTPQAQNALLKTIEEPPEYGIVIIITSQPEKLLPTIRSRCVMVLTKPVKEKDIHDYLVSKYSVSEDKATFAIEYAQGNLGKAILLASNENYEKLVQSVIDLESNLFDMELEDISYTIQQCENYQVHIQDYLDLMMMWYRDILVLKVTGNPDKILFKKHYSVIREQANYLSFNELEAKSKAITVAKERIEAKAKLEDIMRLLIMTLKEV